MIANPWTKLPNAPPFVLPEDSLAIEVFNETASPDNRISLEFPPEPFFGSFKAPIVILLLNPGLRGDELFVHEGPSHHARLLRSLAEANGGAHFHLAENASGPGFEWWERTLRPLIDRYSRDRVASNVLAVEYFPYHSRKFGHGHVRLPSQEFGVDLVRDSLRRGAEVVAGRGVHLWLGAVPELAHYPKLRRQKNPRAAAVSARNLTDAAAFEILCSRLDERGAT